MAGRQRQRSGSLLSTVLPNAVPHGIAWLSRCITGAYAIPSPCPTWYEVNRGRRHRCAAILEIRRQDLEMLLEEGGDLGTGSGTGQSRSNERGVHAESLAGDAATRVGAEAQQVGRLTSPLPALTPSLAFALAPTPSGLASLSASPKT